MSTDKRLTFITNLVTPYQVKFCQALNDIQGWDVRFLFCTDTKEDRPDYWRVKLPQTCKVLNPVYFHKSRKYINPTVIKELEKFRPHIILLGGLFIPTVLLSHAWATIRNTRVFLGPLEIPHPSKQTAYLRTRLSQSIYSKVDGIFAVGQRAVDYYSKIFPKKPIHNFPYAADLESYFKHALREKNSNSSGVKFLFSGRLVTHNAPLLAKVFALLHKKYNNTQLVLCAPGKELEKFQNCTSSLHLPEGALIWRTAINQWEEIPTVYQEADVLVFPTGFCGWGLVIPEAMASGMGVISSKHAVAGEELITHGVNGYLIEPSVDELYKCMESYLKKPSEVARHGASGRLTAAQYTFEYKAKELTQLLQEYG